MPSQIDEYTCTKTLGSGVSAKVKLATKEGKQYALKVFDKSNHANSNKVLELLKKEVDTIKHLNHPNLVNLIAFKDSAIWKKSDGKEIPIAYIVLELISGGELFDFVASTGAFSEPVCRYYFKQML